MPRPKVLISRERNIRRRVAGSSSVFSRRVQWRIMPSWLRLNETNTPTMYSWISRVVSASKASIRTMARPARKRMPLL